MIRRLIFFFILIVSFTASLIASIDYYGLTFSSHNVNQDVRTSLNLTPSRPMSFPNGFTLEFDIKFNLGIQTYGYVCRVSSGNENFDVISNINARKLNCVMIRDGHALSNVDFHISPPDNRHDWYRVKICFGYDSITCFVGDSLQRIPVGFQELNHMQIVFGKNSSSDVPPITIKDVVLRDDEGVERYYWKLDRYAEGKVYDDISRHAAIVENGNWEIDRYIKWHKEYSIPIEECYAQLAFDSIENRFFIATTDSMLFFDLDNFDLRRVKTVKGSPFAAGATSQMIYDQNHHRLVSYDLLYPNLIFYDFEKNEWSDDNLDQRFAPAHHHNRFIDEERNCIVTFGGYGYQFYKAWMAVHPLDGDKWQINDMVDSIAPRYLAALGYEGDGKFLIMGGYGSISGRQEESPCNFYDLYELDSRHVTCRKLYDLDFPEKPIAFGHSMIIDGDRIYALAYDNNKFHTQLKLCQVELSDGSVQFIADSIPYNFLDMESYCNLILNREKSQFYAVVLQKSDSHGYSLDFYSLAYPPLPIASVMQEDPINRGWYFWVVGAIVVLILIIRLIIWRLGQRSTLNKEVTLSPRGASGGSVAVPIVEIKSPVSTIKLLGGFQVFDDKGQDITDRFTSIVRQIFLFILLNTVKDGKKVTSERLDETFWFGMSKSSASNNRSVNIRKLRLLLEQVGNVFVVNRKSYWFIDIGEGVKCDYKEIMILLKQARGSQVLSLDLLNAILDIAQQGTLLPSVNNEWVDDYKSEYSNMLIDVLHDSFSLPDVQQDLNLQVKIGNVMLQHDSLNEEAVSIKCRALFQLGQKGSSKLCFDKFVQEYQRLLESEPNINYEDIIKD